MFPTMIFHNPRLFSFTETSVQIEDGVGERGAAPLHAVLHAVKDVGRLFHDAEASVDIILDCVRRGSDRGMADALDRVCAQLDRYTAPYSERGAGGVVAEKIPDRYTVEHTKALLERLLSEAEEPALQDTEASVISQPVKALSTMMMSAVSAAHAACEAVRGAPASPLQFAGVEAKAPPGRILDLDLLYLRHAAALRDTLRACKSVVERAGEDAVFAQIEARRAVHHILATFAHELQQRLLGPAVSGVLAMFMGSRLILIGLRPSQLAKDLWASGDQAPSLSALVESTVARCVASMRARMDHVSETEALMRAWLQNRAAISLAHARSGQSVAANQRLEAVRIRLARYQWEWAPVLMTRTDGRPPLTPSLPYIVDELQKGARQLQSIQSSWAAQEKELRSLQDSARQRLAWASGSSSAAMDVLKVLDARWQETKEYVRISSKACTQLAHLSQAAAQFERYRASSADIHDYDLANANGIQSTLQALLALEEARGLASKLEKQLPVGLKAMAPRGQVTLPWLRSRRGELPRMIASADVELGRVREESGQVNFGALALGSDALRETLGELDGVVEELRPLLQPLVQAHDPAATAVVKHHQQWHQMLETVVGAANLISELSLNKLPLPPGFASGGTKGYTAATIPSLADLFVFEEGTQGPEYAHAGGLAVEMASSLVVSRAPPPVEDIRKGGARLYELILSLQTAGLAQIGDDEPLPDARAGRKQQQDLGLGAEGRPSSEAGFAKTPGDGEDANADQRRPDNRHAVLVWQRVRNKLEGHPTGEQTSEAMNAAEQVRLLRAS